MVKVESDHTFVHVLSDLVAATLSEFGAANAFCQDFLVHLLTMDGSVRAGLLDLVAAIGSDVG